MENSKKPTEAITPSGDVLPIGAPGTDDSEIILHDDLPIGEKYDIALKISCPILAKRYFEACVSHTMKTRGKTRAEAEGMERTTLMFVAKSHGDAAIEKVKMLYSPTKE